MSEKPHHNKDWLHQKYHVEGLTQKEMGEIVGVGQDTISVCMDRYGVDTRKPKWKSTNPATFYHCNNRGTFYEYWNSQNDFVPVHRLLAVAEYGFEAVKGKDVHHKNGLSWDNRPENIELLTRSEHMKEHWDNDVMNPKTSENSR